MGWSVGSWQAAGLQSILREKLIAWACVSDGKFVRKAAGAAEPYIRGLDVAQGGEGLVQWSGVKGKVRAVEKCYLAYGGDVSRLLDLCREAMVFERLEQVGGVRVWKRDSEFVCRSAGERMGLRPEVALSADCQLSGGHPTRPNS